MDKSIVIVGAHGGAYDLLDAIETINSRTPYWRLLGFLDDTADRTQTIRGFDILGGLREAPQHSNCYFINSIGSPSSYPMRPHLIASMNVPQDCFATLVHPGAFVSDRASLGLGVTVGFGVSIAGGVKIGNHVTISPGCVIGHDAVIEDYTVVAPRAVLSGNVHIGQNCYIGANCTVRENITVGELALLGMASVVIRDVPPLVTVIGNPAGVLRFQKLPGVGQINAPLNPSLSVPEDIALQA